MIILVLFSVHQGGVYCYASGGGRINACLEFKEMVKDLHLAGIEVIMDVVYNRTNEVDDKYPYTTSFLGIPRCLTYNNYTKSAPCIGMTNTGPTVFHRKLNQCQMRLKEKPIMLQSSVEHSGGQRVCLDLQKLDCGRY
ncbi:unnamed protein product [Lactuca saligna]|uniref:Uncharacterized protein n=1 Tax=Lactuca saligna TaxID=75948 RepID=A0AA36EMK4_LACSI|nr:unnamed protein product [Lactuca saligna]